MGNLRDLFLLWIIRLKRKKTVIHLHGGYFRELIDHDIPKWQRKKNVKALSKIDRAVVLSESFRKIFAGLLEEKKIEVVPNFFDCSEDEAEKSIKEDSTKKKVLYLSNMIESKGYKEVLQLAIIEKKEAKGYHFDFAGAFFEASLQNEFEKIVSDNELGDIVTYHGVVEGKKKQELLDNSDIFILLTRYPKEGQPISILEAMANGLAIIATDHAAIPDMIKDGENGILVRKETSANDIYEAMKQLDLETISRNNINVANTFYSKSNYINNMRRVFENTMNGIEK
ncbi:MAG: glycosyltransferase family 4 protein [Lachnospiraceae bacterium]|nr:glycosyltransferase family 4 protein [Lachnospiraceae bacterium]